MNQKTPKPTHTQAPFSLLTCLTRYSELENERINSASKRLTSRLTCQHCGKTIKDSPRGRKAWFCSRFHSLIFRRRLESILKAIEQRHLYQQLGIPTIQIDIGEIFGFLPPLTSSTVRATVIKSPLNP